MNWKHEPFQGVAVKTLKGNDIPTQPAIYLILATSLILNCYRFVFFIGYSISDK